MTHITIGLARLVLLVYLLLLAPLSLAQTNDGLQNTDIPFDWTVLTNSPADTLASFLRMAQQIETSLAEYRREKTRANYEQIRLVNEQIMSLIDLSQVAVISRRDSGVETVTALLDVFSRIGFPDVQEAPTAEAVRTGGQTVYSIPSTPFRIVQIAEGPRSGEWLFEARTVTTAPSFLKGVAALPILPQYRVTNWRLVLQQTTGPVFPDAAIDALPEWMNNLAFGVPIWKVITTLVLTVLTAVVVYFWLRILPKPNDEDTGSGKLLLRVLGPVGVNLTVLVVYTFMRVQLNLSGSLSTIAGVTASIIYWITFAWGFWLITAAVAERVMEKTDYAEGSVDANMVNLCGRVFGVVGAVIILAFGAQTIGVPVLSLLAGLGIGGIAVALAVRPTLENLIGGIVLFLDKPIRINEYCSFGDKSGTVEKIGARSVQIRAVDRTTITIPNSRFADMEIVNWSRCDRLHIDQKIGLRYETSTEQVQYILAKVREMFIAHPKIDSASGRAMFTGYGDTSLNIIIQAYVDSPYWTEYFAVREDVLLRVQQIIEDSGTYYAVPTRALYVQRDKGVDQDRATQVEQELDDWRSKGEFPFPRFSEDTAQSFQGQIEYPVPGSPDYSPPEAEAATEDKKA